MPMRNSVFVDTSGWLCFTDQAQPEHEFTKNWLAHHLRNGGKLVSTSEVFSELLALLTTRSRISRPQILDGIVRLRLIPSLEIAHITSELHEEAFQLLQARPDKNWSWVDAASFVVMQHYQLTQALTTDHHFAQAGFEVLI